MDHEEFFKRNGSDAIELRNYGAGDQVTVEQLYQHFKARMAAEQAAMLTDAELVALGIKAGDLCSGGVVFAIQRAFAAKNGIALAPSPL